MRSGDILNALDPLPGYLMRPGKAEAPPSPKRERAPTFTHIATVGDTAVLRCEEDRRLRTWNANFLPLSAEDNGMHRRDERRRTPGEGMVVRGGETLIIDHKIVEGVASMTLANDSDVAGHVLVDGQVIGGFSAKNDLLEISRQDLQAAYLGIDYSGIAAHMAATLDNVVSDALGASSAALKAKAAKEAAQFWHEQVLRARTQEEAALLNPLAPNPYRRHYFCRSQCPRGALPHPIVEVLFDDGETAPPPTTMRVEEVQWSRVRAWRPRRAS